ncbi:Serine/threonine-protein kinase PknB [Labilithrix luteola]|uniref:non-specific serine/threonine protein kinase n=1 Tax=Labilithrix luteola TaxID=1391654 RepID=A0A0K1Q8K8_9BACT|nr:serine/threonine-protein kinase [Labilithrix luteola]AKV02146.1 Serine/threonine-protein kinase PknB [Labilithrix luteola]
MQAFDDSLPRLLGGRYRLEKTLGQGGMGIVYRATDMQMHRPVAVKLIRSGGDVSLDEEVAGRFLREAKNTARVQHENIIEVYDLGRADNGDLFFVMELLEGESLSTRMRKEGRLTPEVAVHIMRQMCAALHVTHTAGIIHRDLKPANVMLLRRAGDSDFVKVLDFGVAKSYSNDQETALTHTGMLVGTLEYMAPEQIMGRKVDGRTDVYSVGIVLFRMLTGKPMFRDTSVPALIHAHLNVKPKPITEVYPKLSKALATVVAKCLEKLPEDRYQTMEELSEALKAALSAEEVGLLSLGYDDDGDPYAAGDATEVVGQNAPPPAKAGSETYEDATVRMDRAPSGPPGSGGPRIPAGKVPAPSLPKPAPPPRQPRAIENFVIATEDLATEVRHVPAAAVSRPEIPTRECAMCRTPNVAHAPACIACGVSLAPSDQAAVRERVVPSSLPPALPPPQPQYPSVPQPLPSGASLHAFTPPPAPLPPPAWAAQAPSPPAAPMQSEGFDAMVPARPSFWRRFLAWLGFGGR